MQVLGPINGGWHHHQTRLSYYTVTLLKLLFLEGQRASFHKAHHLSTEEPKALVGFKPRTEPGLSTRHSNSTSAFYVIMHVLLL